MQHQTTELTEPRAATLVYVLEHGGNDVFIKNIADAREVSNEAQRRLCNRMEDDGLLDVQRNAAGSTTSLTEPGKDRAIEVRYGPRDVGTGEDSERLVRRLHGVTLTVEIKNRERLPDRWRSVLASRSDLKWTRVEEYDEQTDVMIAYRKRWVMRFHRTSVSLQMREGESIEAFSTADCFRELVRRARDGLRWVRQMTGLQVDMQQVEIGRAELAYEKHHLAMLADDLPGLRMDDIVVHDAETGKVGARIDASRVPEVEAEHRAEEIGELLEDELGQFVNHGEAVRTRHILERELVLRDVDPVNAAAFIAQGARELDDGGEDGGGGGDDAPGSSDAARSSGEGWESATGWGWEW